MWFRNLTLFRFPKQIAVSLNAMETSLEQHRLRSCGPLELATRGFVSPLGRGEEQLTHQIGSFALFTMGGEDKLLPSAVVNEALALKLETIVEEEGRRVGAPERKRLKEEVMTDLLPRAFVRPVRTSGYFDLKQGWLVLDTASRKVAEETVSQLREAFGTLPVVPATPEESPRRLMTEWLTHGKLHAGFTLEDECELRDPTETGAIVRCRRQDLDTDEVREHLKSGKQVFQLGLTWEDRISFVLGEDLTIRKLRFLDAILDELDDEARESPMAELNASFTLMTLELERFLLKIEEVFGVPRPTDSDRN